MISKPHISDFALCPSAFHAPNAASALHGPNLAGLPTLLAGAFANAQPSSIYTGLAVNMLKQVGSMLDMVLVMSYDASNAYDPRVAYNAYRSYYSGALASRVAAAVRCGHAPLGCTCQQRSSHCGMACWEPAAENGGKPSPMAAPVQL